MKLLRLNDNYEAEIERETLALIPEFAALFTLNYNKADGDIDGRKRYRARAELTWMYFMYDYRSEYAELPDDERHAQAMAAANLPEDYRISSQLEAAAQKFQSLQNTRELRMLTASRKAADRVEKYLLETEITNNNVKTVKSTIDGIGATIEGLKKLEEQVRKAERADSRTRGDHERGRLTS